MRYRRSLVKGGTYFFTVTLADRRSDLLVRDIDHLRTVTRTIQQRHPFQIVAAVVLPDHLHTIWELPEGDADYPQRWALIKSAFARAIPKTELIAPNRVARRERAIWQRRYWEHQIRDDIDLQTHVDYVHHNPVKHGHAVRAEDWPYSSIHRFIREGLLKRGWGVE